MSTQGFITLSPFVDVYSCSLKESAGQKKAKAKQIQNHNILL